MNEDAIPIYVREWTRYLAAASKVAKTFRYLDRHYVQEALHEGRENIYPVYELHLVQWRCAFFPEGKRSRIRCALNSIDLEQGGSTVEGSEIQTITKSFDLLGVQSTDYGVPAWAQSGVPAWAQSELRATGTARLRGEAKPGSTSTNNLSGWDQFEHHTSTATPGDHHSVDSRESQRVVIRPWGARFEGPEHGAQSWV